jgi:hypothetical protein
VAPGIFGVNDEFAFARWNQSLKISLKIECGQSSALEYAVSPLESSRSIATYPQFRLYSPGSDLWAISSMIIKPYFSSHQLTFRFCRLFAIFFDDRSHPHQEDSIVALPEKTIGTFWRVNYNDFSAAFSCP